MFGQAIPEGFSALLSVLGRTTKLQPVQQITPWHRVLAATTPASLYTVFPLRFRSLRSNRLVWISWRVFLTPCNALFLNAWELMAATLHAYSFDGITPVITPFYYIGARETSLPGISLLAILARPLDICGS